jgi:hypothetical protein
MNKRQQLARKAIAYSTDALIPGFYIWLGNWSLRIGGSVAEDSYPGAIHSRLGVALVLPGYHIWSTYQGSYDP